MASPDCTEQRKVKLTQYINMLEQKDLNPGDLLYEPDQLQTGMKMIGLTYFVIV